MTTEQAPKTGDRLNHKIFGHGTVTRVDGYDYMAKNGPMEMRMVGSQVAVQFDSGNKTTFDWPCAVKNFLPIEA